jgi:hypothetical protein
MWFYGAGNSGRPLPGEHRPLSRPGRPARRPGLGEALDRFVFGVVRLEDREQLGDREQILELLGEVEQLELAALAAFNSSSWIRRSRKNWLGWSRP